MVYILTHIIYKSKKEDNMTLIKWNKNPVDVMPRFSNLVDNFFTRDFPDYLHNESRGSVRQ
jgi:hypothetical protein